MRAKPAYRDRDETEVAVLDALADRNGEGMTVFEIRAVVDEDIDTIEAALAALKADGLIDATQEGKQTVITVDERVIGPGYPENGVGFFEKLRQWFPF